MIGIAICRRPAPMTWGEQTDVPESADWYNSGFPDALGFERAANAHARRSFLYGGSLYKARKIRRNLSGLFRSIQIWRISGCHPKQGTDAALAMAFGHVILQANFISTTRSTIFEEYARQYTDMPMLVRLIKKDGQASFPTGCLRASEFRWSTLNEER